MKPWTCCLHCVTPEATGTWLQLLSGITRSLEFRAVKHFTSNPPTGGVEVPIAWGGGAAREQTSPDFSETDSGSR